MTNFSSDGAHSVPVKRLLFYPLRFSEGNLIGTIPFHPPNTPPPPSILTILHLRFLVCILRFIDFGACNLFYAYQPLLVLTSSLFLIKKIWNRRWYVKNSSVNIYLKSHSCFVISIIQQDPSSRVFKISEVYRGGTT